jgi:hypothetical protein
MLSIRKQRASASDRKAASVWTRPCSPATGAATLASGGESLGCEAASVHGAPDNGQLDAQEISTALINRQVLI